MATNTSVNSPLSGTTGTGNFVGATSPTLTGIISDKITWSDTTKGIVGTTTNNDASAGYVGEYISSIGTVAVSLTSNVVSNATSISLTAGDWDVYGSVYFQPSATINSPGIWTSSTSATTPDAAYYNLLQITTIYGSNMIAPVRRFSLSGTTTVYLSFVCTIPSGTCTIERVNLFARRVR